MIYLQLFWCFFSNWPVQYRRGLRFYASDTKSGCRILSLAEPIEFSDVITISQMTPGPIAINSASFVGIQMGGVLGAVVATLGCILPSCTIVLCLAFLYYKYKNLSVLQGVLKGLRPSVIAMITGAGLSLFVLAAWND